MVNHSDNATEGRSSELSKLLLKEDRDRVGRDSPTCLARQVGHLVDRLRRSPQSISVAVVFSTFVYFNMSSKTCFLFLFQSWFLWQNLPANKQLKSHHYNLEPWIRKQTKKSHLKLPCSVGPMEEQRKPADRLIIWNLLILSIYGSDPLPLFNKRITWHFEGGHGVSQNPQKWQQQKAETQKNKPEEEKKKRICYLCCAMAGDINDGEVLIK